MTYLKIATGILQGSFKLSFISQYFTHKTLKEISISPPIYSTLTCDKNLTLKKKLKKSHDHFIDTYCLGTLATVITAVTHWVIRDEEFGLTDSLAIVTDRQTNR